MYSLPIIQALNANPPALKTNFNRDSSAIKSRDGYVIHSGVHRSTAFVSDAVAVYSLRFWKDYGQASLNAWIEATIDGYSLANCEANAIAKLWPEWTFTAISSSGKSKSAIVTATHGKALQTRISGKDWQDLQARLTVLTNRKAS